MEEGKRRRGEKKTLVLGFIGPGAKSLARTFTGDFEKQVFPFGKADVAAPIESVMGSDGVCYSHVDQAEGERRYGELAVLRAALLLLSSCHVAVVSSCARCADGDALRTLRVLAEARRALVPGISPSTPVGAPGRCVPIVIFALPGGASVEEGEMASHLGRLIAAAGVAGEDLARPLLAMPARAKMAAKVGQSLRESVASACEEARRDGHLANGATLFSAAEQLAAHVTAAASRSDRAQQPSRGWSPMERAAHRLAQALKPEEDASRERCRNALSLAKQQAGISNALATYRARARGPCASKLEDLLVQEASASAGDHPPRCEARSVCGRQCVHSAHPLPSSEALPPTLLQSAGRKSHSAGVVWRGACCCGSNVTEREEPFTHAEANTPPPCWDACPRCPCFSLPCWSEPGGRLVRHVTVTFTGVGGAGQYDTAHGLQAPGFKKGLNKLAAMRQPIPVPSLTGELAAKLPEPPRKGKRAKPKLSIGFEYETLRGMRFIARPEHVGLSLSEAQSKHAGDSLLASDLPLFLPAASNEPAQLVKVHIVTPPASICTVYSRPELVVPPKGSTCDHLLCPERQVALPPDSLVAIHLPVSLPGIADPAYPNPNGRLLAYTSAYCVGTSQPTS